MSDRPEWEEPLDEMTPAEVEEIEIGSEPLPPLKTAAELLAEQEEIPPEPPLSAGAGGPQPPEGLRFDFAWERTVVPASAGERDRERIRDEAEYVPLPLSKEAVAEWSKSQAIWIQADDLRPYDYLFRRGHLGALAHLYPAFGPRAHDAQEFASLLTRHGFTDKQAVKAAKRRQTTKDGDVSQHPAVVILAGNEAKHGERKDDFAKAYLAAQKKKGVEIAPPRKGAT